MSTGIRNHKKFASPDELSLILEAIGEKPSSVSKIKNYCSARSLDLALSFDSSIDLLSFINLVQLDDDTKLISKKDDMLKHKDTSEEILELIVNKMIADNSIMDVFNPLGVKYDVVLDRIAIRNSSVSLSMSGIKNLFIGIGFFDRSNLSENLLIINPRYADFFREIILPVITPEEITERDGMSLEELKNILEQKQLYGKMGEEFVFEYEKRRLHGHPAINKVKIISDIDCGAGYDIISFENIESQEINRFIEVKSYSGKPQFYWSKNEVKGAQARGDSYFLYLVNRDKVSDQSYTPQIIQAPFRTVFLNETIWNREAQSWKFFQK